jgi:hypothetical protein
MHRVNRPTHASMHDYVRENMCTSMNDAFMDLVGPSTNSSVTPNMF